MTKLDWGKASLREIDPARVQRTNDFIEPDPVVVVVRDLTPKEKRLAADRARRRQSQAKRKAASEPIRKKQKDQKATPQDIEKKRAAAEARRVARIEHQKRFLAKAERRATEMVTKKKTHLQAWAEKQTGFSTDREKLHEIWRSKLLRQKSAK